MTITSRRGAAGSAGSTAPSLSADYELTRCTSPCRDDLRSITMNSLHEALARERLRELQLDARRARVAREMAAARRWRRRELRARAAHQRHAQHLQLAEPVVEV